MSSNPVLRESTFQDLQVGTSEQMTFQGVVNKTALLLVLLTLSASFVWIQFYKGGSRPEIVAPWLTVGVIGGLIVALVTVFKPQWSMFTAPIYAALEGLFIGGISGIFEASYPGIVFQAVSLTFGTLFALLFAYKTGIIRATEQFKLGVFAATAGIAILYLITMVLSFFNIQVPFIYGNSGWGIAFSVFVVVIAALNLIIDFDMIETGVKARAPKYMEWYGGFALMVTLVWLYIEFLRLLSKVRSRQS